jgi:outer membrane protein assembly factor BamB
MFMTRYQRAFVYLSFSLLIAGIQNLACNAAFSDTPQEASTTASSHWSSLSSLARDALNQGGLMVLAGDSVESYAQAFGNDPKWLVQALISKPDQLWAARNRIRMAGRYGRVSAIHWPGGTLPYADSTVNIFLMCGDDVQVSPDEIERVLIPNGLSFVIANGEVTSYTKPWPDDIDHWSHSRYDSSGNAVTQDGRVGPPQSLQWEALPRWNRGVKTSGLVSMNGRLFYILDDSHFAEQTRTWSVICRNAFNGLQLWRSELPSWGGAQGGKKVGPVQINRRLVAVGDRVYVPLGDLAPVSVLDAASGETLRILEETGRCEEFLVSEGILVALSSNATVAELRRGQDAPMRIAAVDPETGDLLWEHVSDLILPMTMTAKGDHLVFHDGQSIHSLDLKTGVDRWTSPPTGQKIAYRDSANPDSPGAEPSTILLAPQFAPTMLIYEDVVAFAGGRQINVVSLDNGEELWRASYAATNYSVPVDLFGFGGRLWGPDPGMNLWRPTDDDISFVGYEPRTGDVEANIVGRYDYRFQHHRCHQMKVVGDTILSGRAGIEFLDTNTGATAAHHWTRGSCYYGVLPANGLLYTPPHDCACYIRAKLSGFLAMTSQPSLREGNLPVEDRLERGHAYGEIDLEQTSASPEDWPTYRCDPGRSGKTSTRVTPDFTEIWRTSLGGKLTSPVVAGGRVYVASTDEHSLLTLDAATGEILRRYYFNARIDSPPTVYQGIVFCGCRDGSVHAIRAEDSTLIWKFNAAPVERLIVSQGQLESTWPVHGSVLVVNDTIYFAAGRSSYLDGGLRLYGLDPRTGRMLIDAPVNSRNVNGSETLDEQGVVGCLNDILSSNGERIFMRHQAFQLDGESTDERISHLHGSDGFLSSDTTDRLLWTYAPMYTSPHQGAFYDLRLSRMLFPSGRILVEDENAVYGYGQNRYGQLAAEPGGQWALFAAEKNSGAPPDLTAREYRTLALQGEGTVNFHWWKALPIQVRAMVMTDDVLFVAGPQGNPLTTQAALEGETAARLLAISPSDGEILSEISLPATPVWDGLAAAQGELYVILANGDVLCL